MDAADDGAYDDDMDDGAQHDAAALVRDFRDHPMMERIHAKLEAQLSREVDAASLAVRERTGEVEKATKHREDVGVELYGIQQQLARLQMALEGLHGQCSTIGELRRKEDSAMQVARTNHRSLKTTVEGKEKRLLKQQAELDALNETLQQIEQYNEQMKNEIAVNRRATYKAEENIQQLESQKKGQDLFITSLHDQVKRLNEQVSATELQIEAQQREIGAAQSMLGETGTEMEMIKFEKKQLVQQWKTSLIQLAKRDEAFGVATGELRAAEMEARDHDTEIEGTKREIMAEQSKNQTLVEVRDRLAGEDTLLEEQTHKVRGERELLTERYQMLQRSMAQTDDEEAGIDSAAGSVQQKMDTVMHNTQVVTRERQKIEEQIAAKQNDQATASKAVQNLHKAAQAVVVKVHEQEMEQAFLENELSRIRVDALNTDAHNVQLRDALQKLVDELKTKDKLIEKYQLEIRQRNDEIEKKMYKVDRLNRKYEKLLDNVEDVEHMGPLEATIKNLRKEQETVEEASTSLQREWLADQTALLNAVSATTASDETNSELQARLSILSEKRLRLLQNLTTYQVQAKSLKQTLESMHTDMARLNELIGKNTKLESELANANQVMEMEFVSELKELEQESVALETQVGQVKAAKETLLSDVIETEKQLLLWEKKIQLERETQAALDPDVGQGEIKGMEKEIHRMRLRLDALKREQERLMAEMERAVQKRELVSLRFGTSKGVLPGSKATHTQASLKKKIGLLRVGITGTAKDAARYIQAINQRTSQVASLTGSLEEATAQYAGLEEATNRSQGEINELLYEKQRRAELLGRRERLGARFEDLAIGDGGAPPAPMEVEATTQRSVRQLADVRGAVGNLQSQFGYLHDVLERVARLATDE